MPWWPGGREPGGRRSPTGSPSGLAALRNDLRRVAAGLLALGRSQRSDDVDETAIGALEAACSTLRHGESNRYTVRIANAGAVARTVVLVLDIAPAPGPGARRGAVATALTLPARGVCVVEVYCDWHGSGSVVRGGRVVPCDRIVAGGDEAWPDRCVIGAVLLDLRGRPRDRLTLEQAVAA
jgi:hypothetical protein